MVMSKVGPVDKIENPLLKKHDSDISKTKKKDVNWPKSLVSLIIRFTIE